MLISTSKVFISFSVSWTDFLVSWNKVNPNLENPMLLQRIQNFGKFLLLQSNYWMFKLIVTEFMKCKSTKHFNQLKLEILNLWFLQNGCIIKSYILPQQCNMFITIIFSLSRYTKKTKMSYCIELEINRPRLMPLSL